MANSQTSNDYTGVHYYFVTFLKNPYSISLCIILACFISYCFMAYCPMGYQRISNKIKYDFNKADSTRAELILRTKESTILEKNGKTTPTKVINPNTMAIVNQYEYLQSLKTQYVDVAETSIENYYSLLTILVISTVATSILVTLIARKGWDKQSPNIQAAFYGTFFCASLTGLLVNSMNLSQNSSDNINKYFYLTNLQTNIYEALVIEPTNNLPINKDSLIYTVFNENNKGLKENVNIFLNVKPDEIPSVSEMVKVSSRHEQNTNQTSNRSPRTGHHKQ